MVLITIVLAIVLGNLLSTRWSLAVLSARLRKSWQSATSSIALSTRICSLDLHTSLG